MARRTSALLAGMRSWSRLQRTLLGLATAGARSAKAGTRKRKPATVKALRQPAAPRKSASVKSAWTPPTAAKPASTRNATGSATSRRAAATGRRTAALGMGVSEQLAFYAKPAGSTVHVRLSYTLYWPAGAPSEGVVRMPPDNGGNSARGAGAEARPGLNANPALPLLVMLHGCQQTVQEFAAGTRMNRLADKQGFAVVYPQQARTRQAHRCWRWFAPDSRSGGREADALALLIEDLLAKHSVLDPTRVYVAGLSAGAGMAALLALRHPHLIAALAMHSGPVVGAADDARAGLTAMRQGSGEDPTTCVAQYAPSAAAVGLPAIILHGKQDGVVAPRNARQLVQQFTFINGLNVAEPTNVVLLAQGKAQAYRRTDYVQRRKVTVRWCELDDVDHAWSGGDPAIKFHTRKGPDATLLIWRFLSAHARSA